MLAAPCVATGYNILEQVGGDFIVRYHLDAEANTRAEAVLRSLRADGVVNNVQFTVIGIPGAPARYLGAEQYNGMTLGRILTSVTSIEGETGPTLSYPLDGKGGEEGGEEGGEGGGEDNAGRNGGNDDNDDVGPWFLIAIALAGVLCLVLAMVFFWARAMRKTDHARVTSFSNPVYNGDNGVAGYEDPHAMGFGQDTSGESSSPSKTGELSQDYVAEVEC